MCGIAGVVSPELAGKGELEPVVGEMLRRLEHRGPDEQGVFVSGAVALGGARLSIVDVKPHGVPLRSTDGRFVISYQGDMRRDLECRPLVRAQALGDAFDVDHLERLARYETHLDRKLERTLSMLIKLQDLRRAKDAA